MSNTTNNTMTTTYKITTTRWPDKVHVDEFSTKEEAKRHFARLAVLLAAENKNNTVRIKDPSDGSFHVGHSLPIGFFEDFFDTGKFEVENIPDREDVAIVEVTVHTAPAPAPTRYEWILTKAEAERIDDEYVELRDAIAAVHRQVRETEKNRSKHLKSLSDRLTIMQTFVDEMIESRRSQTAAV